MTGHREVQADLETDAEGWLVGDRVERVPSVRHSALAVPAPLGIVWHYTATDHGTAKNLAKRIRTYKRGVDRAASWHVLVGHDGVIWQSVPFLRGAWHCAKGAIEGFRVNACTIGIEIEGHAIDNPHEAFAAQTHAMERLIVAIHEAYPSIRVKHAARGHSEFDPTRRSDPGPGWSEVIRYLVAKTYDVNPGVAR